MLKRILAMLLAIVMLTGTVGTSAFAEETAATEEPAEAAQPTDEPAAEPVAEPEPAAEPEPEPAAEPEPEPEPEESAAEPLSFAFLGAKSLDADGTAHYEAALEGESALLTVQTDYAGELIYLWQRLDAESGEYINIDVQLNPTAAQQTLELPAAEVMADAGDAYRCAVTAISEGGALEKYAFFTVVSTEAGETETEQYGDGITTEAALRAALAAGAVTLDADITLTADLTLANDLDVGSYTLTVDAGATLTVPDGRKLKRGVYDRDIIVKNGTLNIATGGVLEANCIVLGYTDSVGAQQNGHLILDGTADTGMSSVLLSTQICSDGSTVTGANAASVKKSKQYYVYTEAQFEAALGADSSAYAWAVVEVKSNISLTKAYTVAAASNKSVQVIEGATLTVENGGSLNLNGANYLATYENGHVKIKSGGSLDVTTFGINTGSIEVMSGGALTSRMNQTTGGSMMTGDSTALIVNAGGVFNLHGSLSVRFSENASIRIDGTFNADSDRSISLWNCDADVSGAGLNGDDFCYVYYFENPVYDDATLDAAIAFAGTTNGWVVVSLTGDLTEDHVLPSNMELTVGGEEDCELSSGTLTVNGVLAVRSQLTVTTGAALVNNGRICLGDAVSSLPENYYDGILTIDGAYSGSGTVMIMSEGSYINGANVDSVTNIVVAGEAHVTTEAQLREAIQQGATELYIESAITLTSSLSIPGSTVTHLSAALTVPAGVTLANGAPIYMTGSASALKISGSMMCGGYLDVDGGAVSVLSGGEFTLGESVCVYGGGRFSAAARATIVNADGNLEICTGGTLTVSAGATLQNDAAININGIANISGKLISSGYIGICAGGKLTTVNGSTFTNSGTVILGSTGDPETDGFLVANGVYGGEGEVQLQTLGSTVTGAKASQIPYNRGRSIEVATNAELDAALKADYTGFDIVMINATGSLTLAEEYSFSESSPVNLSVSNGSLTVADGAVLRILGADCGLQIENGTLRIENGGSVETGFLFSQKSGISVENGGALALGGAAFVSSLVTVDVGGSLSNNGFISLNGENSQLLVNGTYGGDGSITADSITALVGGATLSINDCWYSILAASEAELRAAIDFAAANAPSMSLTVTEDISVSTDLHIPSEIDNFAVSGATLTMASGILTLDAYTIVNGGGTLAVAYGAKLVNNCGIQLGTNSDDPEYPSSDGRLVLNGEYEFEGGVSLETDGSSVLGENAGAVVSSRTKYVTVSTTAQLDRALLANYSGYDCVNIRLAADISLAKAYTLPEVGNINFDLYNGNLTFSGAGSLKARDGIGYVCFNGGDVTLKSGSSLKLNGFTVFGGAMTLQSGSTLSTADMWDSKLEYSELTVNSGATFANAGNLSLVNASTAEVNGTYKGSDTRYVDIDDYGFIIIENQDGSVSGTGIIEQNTYFLSYIASQEALTYACAFEAASTDTVVYLVCMDELNLNTDITLPSNVRMEMSYAPLTVSSGTFTVNNQLRIIGATMTVDSGASLVNNGEIGLGSKKSLSEGGEVDGSLVLNGAYSGSGDVFLRTAGSAVTGTNAGQITGKKVMKYYLASAVEDAATIFAADYTGYDEVQLIIDFDMDVTGQTLIPLQENVKLILRNSNITVKKGGLLELTGEGKLLVERSTLSATGGDIKLSGPVVEVRDDGVLSAAAGSSITATGCSVSLAAPSALAIDGTLNIYGGAAVIAEDGAKVYNNGTVVLGVTGDGTTEMLSVYGAYQGKGKIVNSDDDSACIVGYTFTIAGANKVAGSKSIKLTGAFAPSNLTNTSIVWSLAEGDEEYAKLTPSGLSATLTAKSVFMTRAVTVLARSIDGMVIDMFPVEISPLSQSVELTGDLGPAENGATLALDIHEAEKTIQLAAITLPADASNEVVWSSSAPAIATVSANGLVTGLKPGVATIKALAKDGSGKYSTVKIQVYYADKAARFTATSEAESIPPVGQLQAGRSAVMRVFGENKEAPMEQGLFAFSIPTSQQAIATVDPETGVITAGGKPGTATVTAALKDDPLKRKATLSVKVIAIQTGSVLLTPELSDELPTVRDLTTRYELLFDKAEMTGAYTFTINPSAKYSDGVDVASPALTYTSSDTGVATVAVKNGVVTVTVKAGATGACTISGVSKDLAKVEGILTVYVRDYSPRLGAKTLTLNPKLNDGESIPLYEAYGNTISTVTLYEYNAVSREYEDAENLRASYSDSKLTVTANDPMLKSGTIKAKLAVNTSGVASETYEFPITVTVKSADPVITVKQGQKFNLFYKTSRTNLAVTAKDTAVNNVELLDIDGNTFDGEYQGYGNLEVSYTREGEPEFTSRNQPYSKVTLRITVEGYRVTVDKTFTIAAVTTKPVLKLTPASSVINTALGEKTTSFAINKNKDPANMELTGTVETTASFADVYTEGSTKIVLQLRGNTGGRAVIRVQNSDWMQPMEVTHTVTVQTALPTARLKKTTVKLNNIFTKQTDSAQLILSQANQSVGGISYVSTAAAGTAARAEADKLELRYSFYGGYISASIRDGETPKAGVYTFTVTPSLSGSGVSLKPVTLRVQVAATAPKVKLSSTALRLNSAYVGEEARFEMTVPSQGYYSYWMSGLRAERAAGNRLADEDIRLTPSYGGWTFSLTRGVPNGTYAYLLTPTVVDAVTNESRELSAVKLSVTVFNNPVISASVTASGKLDAIDPYSAITYKLTKLTNISGYAQAVRLEGEDADKFELALFDGTASAIRLKPDEDYATNATYKLRLCYTLDSGVDVRTPVLSVRVTQSALKLKAEDATVTAYQSQSASIKNGITLTSPTGARIGDVEISNATPLALRQALGNSLHVNINPPEGKTAKFSVTLENSAKLKAGASYALILDVTPDGSATNVKPTQVRVTVKVAK